MTAVAPLRWGVIAPTAAIARLAVLPALAASPSAAVVAVGSRSADAPAGRAQAGVGPEVRWYRSYEAVLADDEVEAVYVPLPNSLHRPWVEAALGAGKHVLCEKPLALTASDAAAMAAAAEAAGRVLLEAYMTPHHPRSQAIAAASREVGPARFARTAFTGRMDRPGNHRWDPAMGGGALADLGIYCLAPVLSFAGGEPEWVAAREVPGTDPAAGRDPHAVAVDVSFAGLLGFAGGLLASFECSFDAAERQVLELVGADAAVSCERAHTPGPEDTSYRWRHSDGRVEERQGGGGELYRLMVEQFAEVVAGREEPLHPLADTLAVARTLDRSREAAADGSGLSRATP